MIIEPRELNEIIELTKSLSVAIDTNENGQRESFSHLSALVVPVGIEPTSSESESEILSIVLRNQKTIKTAKNSPNSMVEHPQK